MIDKLAFYMVIEPAPADPEIGRRLFVSKYGFEPAEVFLDLGRQLWVGPHHQAPGQARTPASVFIIASGSEAQIIVTEDEGNEHTDGKLD